MYNAKDIDIVMPVYNLIEYSDNYWKTSRSLWQCYRYKPALTNAGTVANFSGNIVSFKFKQKKITGSIGDDDTKDVKILIPLKHLSNFSKTLEM